MSLYFTSLKTCLTYMAYINKSTGYYEIESISGVIKDSGHTLSEPCYNHLQGIIREFIKRS